MGIRAFSEPSLGSMIVGVDPGAFPSFLSGSSWLDRINRWMLRCFLESHNLRILTWYATAEVQHPNAIADWVVEVVNQWAPSSTNDQPKERPLRPDSSD